MKKHVFKIELVKEDVSSNMVREIPVLDYSGEWEPVTYDFADATFCTIANAFSDLGYDKATLRVKNSKGIFKIIKTISFQ